MIMSNSISKTAEDVQPSSIRKMFNLAAKIDGVINLGIGEPDFDTPPNIVDAAVKAMHSGATHYTSNVGNKDLREAVSEKVSRENGLVTNPDKEIIITTGAMGGLFLSLQSIIDRGDEVIIPVPSWPNYINQVIMAGGVPVFLNTDFYSDFIIDPDRLSELITPRTKAVMISTPANPTGAVVFKESLEMLASIVLKHDLFVISDEVYEYFIWDGTRHTSIASLPGMKDRTITINSLSKAYAMTGWRIGYTVAPPFITETMVKLQENVYACVNSIAQAAAFEALTGTQEHLRRMIGEYGKRRDFMLAGLASINGFKVFKPQGAFYIVVDIGALDISSDVFALKLLMDKKVCLVPGSSFGDCGTEYVRISYANRMDALERAVQCLEAFVDDL